MVSENLIHPAVIVAVLVVLILYLAQKNMNVSKRLPPGPYGFPIIGSLHLVLRDPMYIAFRKLRKQYGDIFSLKIGSKLAVVINGYENLREAFILNGNVFSDRPDLHAFVHIFKEKGIAACSQRYWKETKSFTLHALKNFGFGKKSLEAKIVEEVEMLHRIIDEQCEKPYDVKETLQKCTNNVICNLVFGYRFEHGDEKFMKLIKLVDEVVRVNYLTAPISFLPFLRFLPVDVYETKTKFKELFAFIDENIAHHRETLDENNPRDYIDTFLVEQKKNADRDVMQDDNIRGTICNFLTAGTQTTGNTLYWAVLFLVKNIDVQNRLRQEIETVVGSSRRPTLDDKPRMIYFEAFITETLRIFNLPALSVPRGLKQDVHFKGYTLPKGTVVFPALGSVMSDPNVFENPTKFDPLRFLNKEGKLCHTEKMTGFSLGTRACVGEGVARMELFLYLTSLVQRYKIVPEDEQNLPVDCSQNERALLREATRFKCKFIKLM